MVSIAACGACTRLFSDDVCSGEVHFQCVPCACCVWHAVPFDEGLTVEARELDSHDCPRNHLFHGVGR